MRDNKYPFQRHKIEDASFYADADVTNILTSPSVYMSTMSSDGNKSLNHYHHQSLGHHHHNHHENYQNHHYHHPYSTLIPPFMNHNQQQRLRNEIIASAAALPSLAATMEKRPLRPFWEMTMQDIDNGNGTSRGTETRFKNRRTVSCLALFIICLTIVVVGISAVTYWTVHRNLQHSAWDHDKTTTDEHVNTEAEANDLVKDDERGNSIVMGEFRITNRLFSAALTIWSSEEFEVLASEVIKSIEEIFLQSPLVRVYNTTQIIGFSNSDPRGVIVALRIALNRALITSAQEVGLTFVQALEQGHGRLPGGSLRVDIRTIKFTGIHANEKVLHYYNKPLHVNVGDFRSQMHDDGLFNTDNTASLSRNNTHLYHQSEIDSFAYTTKRIMLMINAPKIGRTKRSFRVIGADHGADHDADQKGIYKDTSVIASDHITKFSNNAYYAHDTLSFANASILNIEFEPEDELKKEAVLDSMFYTRELTNDERVFDVHANDESDAHMKLITNETINDYFPKISHWDLNESMRSLFIAISATVPPIIVSNAGNGASNSAASPSGSASVNLKASWSNWSEWSPCRGINRRCDPGRIHSRIRKCIAENSGDVVNSDYCRMNDGELQELEIRDCRCDEITGESGDSFTKSISVSNNDNNNIPSKSKLSRSDANGNNSTSMITAADEEVSHSANIERRDRPCNDCKENEICLLQVKAAVPFCAKIKDPGDPRGCGGWCSGYKELCRYVGASTYQCVDDSECLDGEWQCANGLCIPETRRCDGHFNCFDMSDEMHCQCKDDEFHCGNKTSCLPLSHKCNGIIECWDGDDEQNCTKLCTEQQYACNTGGQCIPVDYFCDSQRHCDDGSDEPDGCNASCLSSERQCNNGRCVSLSVFCDGINNCGDNSDEIDCFRERFATNGSKTLKNHFRPLSINNRVTSAPYFTPPQILIQSRGKPHTDTTISIKTILMPSSMSPLTDKESRRIHSTTQTSAKRITPKK